MGFLTLDAAMEKQVDIRLKMQILEESSRLIKFIYLPLSDITILLNSGESYN